MGVRCNKLMSANEARYCTRWCGEVVIDDGESGKCWCSSTAVAAYSASKLELLPRKRSLVAGVSTTTELVLPPGLLRLSGGFGNGVLPMESIVWPQKRSLPRFEIFKPVLHAREDYLCSEFIQGR